jgi:hypothetical protein
LANSLLLGYRTGAIYQPPVMQIIDIGRIGCP